jgi:hypothetical protein
MYVAQHVHQHVALLCRKPLQCLYLHLVADGMRGFQLGKGLGFQDDFVGTAVSGTDPARPPRR